MPLGAAVVVSASVAPALCYVLAVAAVHSSGSDRSASSIRCCSRRPWCAHTARTASTLVGQVAGTLAAYWLLPTGTEVVWARAVADVLLGMLLVDTAEYWCHRLMHSDARLYARLHRTHHAAPPAAELALLNSSGEAALTGTTIFVLFAAARASWCTLVAVTSLASIKTVWDHGLRGTSHALHHANPRVNFEQPFFHVWDVACGTYSASCAPSTSAPKSSQTVGSG